MTPNDRNIARAHACRRRIVDHGGGQVPGGRRHGRRRPAVGRASLAINTSSVPDNGRLDDRSHYAPIHQYVRGLVTVSYTHLTLPTILRV